MIKKILLFILVATALYSCEESDLSDDNPTLSTNNVQIATSFLYNDRSIDLDSIYLDAAGNEFYISEVKVLLSNMYLIDYYTDTLPLAERVIVSTAKTDTLITRLTPGGYSASFHADVGLDSNSVKEVQKSGALSNDDALLDSDVQRASLFTGRGYNHLIIKGAILDKSNPLDSNARQPFVFKIGTDELYKNIRTGVTNFRVESEKPIKFIFAIDIGDALSTRNILIRPEIDSDQSNSPDFIAATEVMNLTSFALF